MTTKLVRMGRLDRDGGTRPVVLAIAGDSASGKTTLAQGLVDALGRERCTSVCTDDYHRYDRAERRELGLTPLAPEANHVDILEQHLQLLALGRPILKPVYDHAAGGFARPEYVQPREFLIVEGLLALSTPLMRACLDVAVFLDPDEALRLAWKLRRDVACRGYTADEVRGESAARAADAGLHVLPQRRFADIVVRFAPGEAAGSVAPAAASGTTEALSAELLLRPTLRYPDFAGELRDAFSPAMSLEVVRDEGNPTDLLRLRGDALPSESDQVEKRISATLDCGDAVREHLGRTRGGRSASLALTQLIVLHHLVSGRKHG